MVIEHAALFVNDLEGARDFFVRFLGGSSNDLYHNKSTGFRSYFISFDSGARLEIMNKPGLLDESKEQERMGYSHIAFSVGSREKVDEITRQVQEAGYGIEREPRMTGDGYYESCIVAVEGNLVELTV